MTPPPIFVVSSGRSGTATLAKKLGIHHEYMISHTQPASVLRYHKRITEEAAIMVLRATHESSYNFTKGQWGDSSNKLSFLIPELNIIFPTCLFIHLVRDGRKVVSSFYNKLSDECYSHPAMRYYLAGGLRPPFEKKYWWPVPPVKLDQFESICWYWKEVNKTIISELEKLPLARQAIQRCEDLEGKPFNVNRPVNYPLSPLQLSTFNKICGPMQRLFGYTGEEYEVNYEAIS